MNTSSNHQIGIVRCFSLFLLSILFTNSTIAEITLTADKSLILKGDSISFSVADEDSPTAVIGTWDVNGNSTADPATGLRWNADFPNTGTAPASGSTENILYTNDTAAENATYVITVTSDQNDTSITVRIRDNKIWQVDNNPGSSSAADFTTLAAVNSSTSVVNGDTVYVRGSGASYGTLDLTKRLHFIGPGFPIHGNIDTQANRETAKTSSIDFEIGSAGSTFTGFHINFSSPTIDFLDSNITLRRNLISSTQGGGRVITIHNSKSNIIIAQNYIENTNSSSSSDAIYVEESGSSGILISNNFISAVDDAISSVAGITISNNVVDGDINVSNSTITNNIVGNLLRSTTTELQGADNSSTHNLSETSQFGTANGNLENIVMTTVFIGTGSLDGQWQLAESGSPAKGAGFDGQDMGMFGGPSPYVLSGIPAIPSIYSFIAPAIGTAAGGLDVTLKTKSNN